MRRAERGRGRRPFAHITAHSLLPFYVSLSDGALMIADRLSIGRRTTMCLASVPVGKNRTSTDLCYGLAVVLCVIPFFIVTVHYFLLRVSLSRRYKRLSYIMHCSLSLAAFLQQQWRNIFGPRCCCCCDRRIRDFFSFYRRCS